jgi:hypothetical protein
VDGIGLVDLHSFLTLLAWKETSVAVGRQAFGLLGHLVAVPIETGDGPNDDRDIR